MEKSIVELLDAHPIKEPKQLPKYKIYCDMDGVLTDFEKRFEHFSGMKPKQYEERFGSAKFWDLIDNQVGLEYWSKMDWMQGGKQLWEFIQPYNPSLLTSPSRQDVSRLGKSTWVKDHLTPLPKVIFAYSKDKQRYANSNSILIDDKKSNINEWTAKGGIALRCKYGNIEPVISALKELGYE